MLATGLLLRLGWIASKHEELTCNQAHFYDSRNHVEHHTAENKINAPGAAVNDSVQGACLA